MRKIIEKTTFNLSIFYIAIYIGMASINPFLILFYQQKGLTFAQIGIASAAFSLVGVFTQPFWGFITDKYLNKRITLIMLGVFCSFIIYSFLVVNSVYSVILAVILLAVFQSSVYPIADAYSYEIIELNTQIQYGRVRLMGNIGYAIGALLLGQIIQYYSLKISYFIYSIVMIIGCFMIAKVKFTYKHTREKINLYDGLKLFKDKRYLILIISAIVCNIAIGGNVSYLAILIQKTGGNTGNLGFVWFLIAMSALPVLYYGKRLITKFNKLNIYLLGIMFYALRFFLDSVFTSYDFIIIIQLLESVSYPLVLLGALEYLNKITPDKVKTTSMTFYTAAYGVGGFIGNITGGMILENANIFLLYRVLSVVSVVGCIVVLMLKKTDKMISSDQIEHNAQ